MPVVPAEIERLTRVPMSLDGVGKHQRSGVDQYGPVEPESHSLMVLTNNGSGWDVLIELDEDGPRGTVVVGEHGEIDLEMAQSLTL